MERMQSGLQYICKWLQKQFHSSLSDFSCRGERQIMARRKTTTNELGSNYRVTTPSLVAGGATTVASAVQSLVPRIRIGIAIVEIHNRLVFECGEVPVRCTLHNATSPCTALFSKIAIGSRAAQSIMTNSHEANSLTPARRPRSSSIVS